MAIYSDGLFNLNAGEEINDDCLRLLNKYSNFNPSYVALDNNFSIYIDDELCSYDSVNKCFIASKSTKPAVVGELSTVTIRIETGKYSLTITDVAGQNLVQTV